MFFDYHYMIDLNGDHHLWVKMERGFIRRLFRMNHKLYRFVSSDMVEWRNIDTGKIIKGGSTSIKDINDELMIEELVELTSPENEGFSKLTDGEKRTLSAIRKKERFNLQPPLLVSEILENR